jgi:hypothetical protein
MKFTKESHDVPAATFRFFRSFRGPLPSVFSAFFVRTVVKRPIAVSTTKDTKCTKESHDVPAATFRHFSSFHGFCAADVRRQADFPAPILPSRDDTVTFLFGADISFESPSPAAVAQLAERRFRKA